MVLGFYDLHVLGASLKEPSFATIYRMVSEFWTAVKISVDVVFP